MVRDDEEGCKNKVFVREDQGGFERSRPSHVPKTFSFFF